MVDILKEAFSIAGIINGVLAAIVFEWLRQQFGLIPSIAGSPPPTRSEAPQPKGDEVDKKYKQRREGLANFVLYLATILLLYYSILLPMVIKSSMVGNGFYISHAKYIGYILPDWTVNLDYFQPKIFVLALVVYIPLLFVVKVVRDYMVYPALTFFGYNVESSLNWRISSLLFFIAITFITAFWITAYFDMEFWIALLLILVVSVGLLAQWLKKN